jgi:DNA excision repair protein ERCC-5
MGVKQLWKLLSPTSQSILLSSLSGKKVAVDASIWLYQFMMAMRDGSGKTLKGAHLIGFLNRILKLLFHGVKPIFVFDGAVPVLKKQTIQQRQARRQLQVDKTERIAEKILEKRIKLFALKAGEEDSGATEGNMEADALLGQQVEIERPTDLELDEYLLPPAKRLKLDAVNEADLRMPDEQELFEFVEV